MKTNNETGRNIAVAAGVYFAIKELINLLLSVVSGGFSIFSITGGFVKIIFIVAVAVLLYTGFKYVNYVVGALVALTALIYLPGNIINITNGFHWLYLLEGIIDIVAAVILFINPNVKEHFSNNWGGGNNE